MRFLSLIMGTREKKKANVIADAEKVEPTKEDVLKVMSKWKGKPHYVYSLPMQFFKDCNAEAVKMLADAGFLRINEDDSFAVLENMFSCLNCVYFESGDRHKWSRCRAKNVDMPAVGLEGGRFCAGFMNRKVFEVLQRLKR